MIVKYVIYGIFAVFWFLPWIIGALRKRNDTEVYMACGDCNIYPEDKGRAEPGLGMIYFFIMAAKKALSEEGS